METTFCSRRPMAFSFLVFSQAHTLKHTHMLTFCCCSAFTRLGLFIHESADVYMWENRIQSCHPVHFSHPLSGGFSESAPERGRVLQGDDGTEGEEENFLISLSLPKLIHCNQYLQIISKLVHVLYPSYHTQTHRSPRKIFALRQTKDVRHERNTPAGIRRNQENHFARRDWRRPKVHHRGKGTVGHLHLYFWINTTDRH